MQLFNNLTTLQKSLIVSILSIILFVSSASLSYSMFSKTQKVPTVKEQEAAALPGAANETGENPNEPKTESCPLNGQLHTKEAKDKWITRIPLAVMIENHTEARPQSGLSSADIVYESIAEGGITRFMGIFLCNFSDVQVGPVRSARTYFLDWLSEYNALYAHVGGANTDGPANALGQIIRYKIKDLNQFGIGFPTFWRDYQRLGHPVATEHTMYSTTEKLWTIGTKRGLMDSGDITSWNANFVSWKFKDDFAAGKSSSSKNPPSAEKIEVSFWQNYGDYSVVWEYDKTCDCYLRKNGGVSHLDLNNKRQLAAKNVVVQFERESHANDGYENNVHLLYGTLGSGKALIFQDGKVIEGKWVKNSRLARSKYLDKNGNEITFNKGVIWIQNVPEGALVNY